MNYSKSLTFLLATVAYSLSPTVGAVPLTEPAGAFEDFVITGTTAAARPELAGVVLEDQITNFSLSGPGNNLTGTIQNRVVRSDVDGTLDFYWRITSVVGNGDITAFRVIGFEGFSLDADWRSDGLGSNAPDTARYFGSSSGAVNFLFEDDPVSPGEESFFFFLDTQATEYTMMGSFDLLCGPTDCISESYATFAPSAIPLPPSIWWSGAAMLGLIGFTRRRH